jgi:hypothetical protein
VEEFDLIAERISMVHRVVKAVNSAIDFFTKKRISHGFKFSWKHVKKADET